MRFYCPKCSNGSKRVYLCDKVLQDHYPNNNLTCYEIWHHGNERPQARCGRGIQMRGPGKKHGGIDDDGDADEEPTRHTDPAADTTSEIAEDTAAPATENTAAAMREVTAAADAEGTVAPGHDNKEGGNTVAVDENLEGRQVLMLLKSRDKDSVAV
ncbi:hypothetical protein PHMEG_00032904 [Phytophthora megakarya]|uniref:Uncharacterized protein n=1 Tax=Phytophthora megakarya TaxID=4795 RepID=A0A225UWX8_9STRA|nr:hypothetical protein PHMEG_00032904 [Phytophthora megakarya]